MTQSLTSPDIGLIVAPARVQLVPGGRSTVVLLVTNNSVVVDQFSLVVDGLEPTWFTVRQGVVNVFPSSQDRLELEIHLPNNAAAGTYDVRLKVPGRAAPDSPAVAHLPVEVLALGTIEAQLKPQRVVIGTRGVARFSVGITNSSNADRLIDLVLDDPADALDVRISPDRVSAPATAAVEAVLTIRPRKRPLVAPQRSYPFIVNAVDAQSLASADGQAPQLLAAMPGELVYAAPLAALAGAWPGLKRALLALAALALALALLIWFLGEPGRASAFVQQVPGAKPLVNAAAAANSAIASALPGSGAAVAAQPPRIKTFALATPGQDGRSDYALVWEVTGADVVKIDGAQQADPAKGALHLEKLDNTEHTLEASKGGASVHQSVGIVILRAPDILQFLAIPDTIAPGQSASLQWKTVRGDRANVGDQTVTPSGGTLPITPATTSSYTLVVENELGRSQQTIQVTVVDVTPAPGP